VVIISGLLHPFSDSGVCGVLCAVWCINIKGCDLRGGNGDDGGKGQTQGFSTGCNSSESYVYWTVHHCDS